MWSTLTLPYVPSSWHVHGSRRAEEEPTSALRPCALACTVLCASYFAQPPMRASDSNAHRCISNDSILI